MRRRLREGEQKVPLPAARKKTRKGQKGQFVYLICLSTHVLLSRTKKYFCFFSFAKKAIKIYRSGRKRKEENLIQGPSSLLLQEILDSIFLPPLSPPSPYKSTSSLLWDPVHQFFASLRPTFELPQYLRKHHCSTANKMICGL